MKTIKKAFLLLYAIFFIMHVINASEMHEAAKNGNLEKIKLLLKNDSRLINEKDKEGDTPLCTSILYRQKEVSLFLIEKGADVNNQNQTGYAPIHWAAMRGDSIISAALIRNGANLDFETSSKQSALHFAAARGHIDVVRLLIENGSALDKNDSYKRTPLLLAARERGGIETVKILIESGANINATDFFGDTPLSLAAWRGFEEIVDYLLKEKAQFSTNDKEGMKLLKYATDKRLWTLYTALINKGGEEFLLKLKKQSVLHWAAAGGSVKIVNDLLDKDMQINEFDQFNWTPLHYASYFGRLEVAKLLIKHGANLNAVTPIGETPFYLAQLENKKQIMYLLSSKGANVIPPDPMNLSGKYMGQKKVGKQLELFAPGIVSRLKGGHSNIAFSIDGLEAFWTEWILNDVGYSGGCILWHSKMKNGVWSLPEKFLDDGDTPFFSPDGKKIFLHSTFQLPPENKEVMGIWYYEIKEDSLLGPKYLNFDVGASGLYWQFSFDKDENLYFSTDAGLFRSLKKDGEYIEKENLAEIFHTDYKGGTPYISPNGDYLIFNSRALNDSFGSTDLYIGYKKRDGTWTKPINMGPTINSSSQEHLPLVTPDGNYLFTRTSRNGVSGIYWIDTDIIDELKPKN